MKRLLFTIAASCALLLVAVPGVRADEYDKKTDVTTSGPIQVPGAVLPAGQYMFKLVNSSSNRHIVQVSSEDGKQVYAVTMAIPARRNRPDDKHILTFYETPQGQPEAVRDWFWPGELDGQEFVYPHRQALAIAQLTGTRIPETSDTALAEAVPAPAPAPAPQQASNETHVEEAAAAPAPAPAAPAPPEPVELAQNTPPPAAAQPQPENPPAAQPAPPPSSSSEKSQDNSELPQTASDLPLIALIGFGALMAAAALRAFTRARA